MLHTKSPRNRAKPFRRPPLIRPSSPRIQDGILASSNIKLTVNIGASGRVTNLEWKLPRPTFHTEKRRQREV
jgi:hypothetical protein